MTTDRFDSNNYSFNESSQVGCYIIHGFSSSTYEVRELAEFLSKNGLHTRADNLPGHGTTPDDCNRAKYTDWFRQVEQGVAEMASHCKEVFVVGVSMGAVLTLHLATIFPLDGIVAAAAVVRFKKRLRMRFLNPVACHFIPFLKKTGMYSKELAKSLYFYGYTVYPTKALNEFYKMNKLVLKNLNSIKCPTRIMYAEKDMTAIPVNNDIIYNGISSKNKKMLGYSKSHHNMFDSNPDQKQIFSDILTFLRDNSRILK